MGKLKLFPGCNCLYYFFGRCIHEEYLNPGFQLMWKCRVLAGLEKDYDGLIHQADVFDLSISQVESIWEKRFKNLDSWGDLCSSYIPRRPGDDRCLYLYGNACILEMSTCQGVCSVFRPGKEKDIES